MMSQRNFSMANQSNIFNTSQPQKQPEAFAFSVQTKITFFSVLLVWSLLGNVLVIVVVIGNKNLRTNFNWLIVNMAASDLFIPLLILPLRIVEVVNGPEWLVDGPLGEAFCKLCYFLTDISPVVSILSLVIITVNRFVSITYPMKIGVLRGKTSWLLLALTWIVSMALFSPYFYTFRLKKSYRGVTYCRSQWSPAFDDLVARTIFITIVIVIAFLVPLTAIVVLYSLMLYQLRKNSERVKHMLNNRQLLSRQRRNKHIAYICIVIIASFICFVGPFFCIMFVVNFIWRWDNKEIAKIKTVLFVVQFLAYFNTAINPCIYFAFLKDYRKGLKRLFIIILASKRKSNITILLRSRASFNQGVSSGLELFPLGKTQHKRVSV